VQPRRQLVSPPSLQYVHAKTVSLCCEPDGVAAAGRRQLNGTFQCVSARSVNGTGTGQADVQTDGQTDRRTSCNA